MWDVPPSRLGLFSSMEPDEHKSVQSYDECRYMAGHTEKNELEAHVIRVIAQTQRIPIDSISPDSTFEQLKIDSLDGINIVFAIENEFGINIPDEGVRNMRSIRETVEGVRRLVEEKNEAVPPSGAA